MWNFYCGHQLNGEILTWFWQPVERARAIWLPPRQTKVQGIDKSDKRRVFHHGSLCLIFSEFLQVSTGSAEKGLVQITMPSFQFAPRMRYRLFATRTHFAYNNNCAGSEQFPLGLSFCVTLFFNRGARNFICRVSLQIRRDWKPSLSSETERLLDFLSS